jgi:hypothetical protein
LFRNTLYSISRALLLFLVNPKSSNKCCAL